MPAEPFSTPTLAVLDSIRVFDQVLAGGLIVLMVLLAVRSTMLGRRVMLAGTILVVAASALTRYSAMGQPISPQLVAGTVGLLVLAAGLWTARARREP